MGKILNDFAKQAFKEFLKDEYEKANQENNTSYIKFLEIIKDQEEEIFTNSKTENKKNILESISKIDSEKPKKERADFKISKKPQSVRDNKESKIGKVEAKFFRGIEKINLDLSKTRCTFFYAPNGCGKTSVSEVLEYGTTNDTEERRNRERKKKDYFQNIYATEDFDVSLFDQEGQTFNKDKWYEKCFIEKNRIEKFANLSILRKDKMNEAIAKLFPNLEDFFILIDEKFINYENFEMNAGKWRGWSRLPDIKREKEEIHKAIREVEEVLGINKELSIEDIKSIKNYFFDDLIEKKEEKLKNIENINLENNLPSTDSERIKKHIADSLNIINSINKLKKSVGENVLESNLLDLYEKSKSYFDSLDDELSECPLCSTKSTAWEENPIEYTTERIESLKEIQNKKNKIHKKKKKLSSKISEIKRDFTAIKTGIVNLEENKFKNYCEKNDLKKINKINIKSVKEIKNISYEKESLEEIKKTLSKFEEKDLNNYENVVEDVRNKIQEFQNKISLEEEKKERLESERDDITNSLQIIKTKKENIKNTKKERKKYEQAERIRKTYKKFYSNLHKFNEKKIKEELKGVEDLIVDIYNYLNQDDLEGEKLKDINISPEDGIIEIKLKNKSEVDSLNILSEGHIKILGLSILFARAVRDDIPFMVMDDVVNAIDIDHRTNIASFLFNPPNESERIAKFMYNIQLILFTHDRFFDEKICNKYISRDYYNHYILLKSYSEEKESFFIHASPSYRNYIKKIKKSIKEEYDLRTALFYTRLTLEDRAKVLCEVLSIADIEGKFRKTSRGLEFSKNETIKSLFQKIIRVLGKKKKNQDLEKSKRKKYCDLYRSVLKVLRDVVCDEVLNLIHKEAHAGSLDYFQMRISAGGIKGSEVKEILEKIENMDQNIEEFRSEFTNKKINY